MDFKADIPQNSPNEPVASGILSVFSSLIILSPHSGDRTAEGGFPHTGN